VYDNLKIPRVSIIIPNLNGQGHIERCLPAIREQDYPRKSLECVVVDNGSVDGSVYFLKRNHPYVNIVSLQKNMGFAAAINAGVQASSGDVVVFLNNDAQLSKSCLTHLLSPILKGQTACTAAKIMSIDGGHVHYAGGGMNFHGIAFQYGDGEPDRQEFRTPAPSLFACGGAMAIRRDVFLEAGGMDEAFFAYFEDVDLGWRLWVMGHDVRFVPEAIAFHNQSATSQFIDVAKIRVLHIRNPLMMMYKNYSAEFLCRILPVAWMLTVRRTLYLSGLDMEPYRIGDEPHLADSDLAARKTDRSRLPRDEIAFPAVAASDFVALNDWLEGYQSLRTKRMWIQERRARPDTEIVPLFKDPFRYSESKADYRRLQNQLCTDFRIGELFP
jgi:hypothetical protein